MNVEAALAAAEPELTPVAVVDAEQMERNLSAMAGTAAKAGLQLRPHAKTHKSVFVARRQLAHGAVGVTTATLQEAETFAAGGVEDIVIAHPPVGAEKARRLHELAERVARLAVAIDQPDVVASLPQSVEILWEVDSGLHRMGTAPGRPTAEAVLSMIQTVSPSRIRGLITHGGHVYRADSETARRQAADEEAAAVVVSAAKLSERGFNCRVLSVGSTPTAGSASRQTGITEMRPGTYVYNDANQVALGSARLEDCALAMIATVISVHPDRAVVDAGSKALSSDLRVTAAEGLGLVLGQPEVRLDWMGEEHGVLVGTGIHDLVIGQRLVIVPTHACTAVNLHSELLSFRPSERHWLPVDARGWRR